MNKHPPSRHLASKRVRMRGPNLHHHGAYPVTIPKIAAAALAILALTASPSFARHPHHHAIDANGNHASHRGSCDGFHRCRCGTTAARLNGLPYNYNGMNLKMAREWYGFPHTGFGVGAVAVYPHHVATITGGSSCSNATVSDDAGTYQRNVCGATFVSPGGGAGAYASTEHSARRHRSHRHERYAVAEPPAAPDVALGVH